MHKPGDIVLTTIQFTDTYEVKKRPALVLWSEFDNTVVAGITSNKEMKGIALTKKDGAIKDSVIKLNYIFTIADSLIIKKLFSLNANKRKEIHKEMLNKISSFSS